MTEAAQTSMTMHDLDFLPEYDVSKNGKEGEDSRHGRLAVHDEKRDVVDFEAICEIADACPALVCVGNNDNLVASINQFLKPSQRVLRFDYRRLTVDN